MFWTMMIRIWRINISHEDFNRLQESAIFHDYEAIDASINMINWVLIIIWLQDHISIWQAKSEIWHADIIITRFAHECRWQINCESISDFVVLKTIWEDTTCFHKLQI